MARSNEEVVQFLLLIYRTEFAGKTKQRYLISWADLRALFGFKRFFQSRFSSLAETAAEHGLHLWDLKQGENGHFVAVVKMRTVDRWRRAPRRIVDDLKAPEAEDDDGADDDE